MNKYTKMLSVCCITYNHEKFIGEALEGFLMQKTTFDYEIIIGDDCSTDQTRAVVLDYVNRYPGKIKLLTSSENIGGGRNFIKTMKTASGKYIALCDGDDYWTDPSKLQMQVDFMESHADSNICCHYSKVINENSELVYENTSPISLEFTYEDVLLNKKDETRVCTMMIRNSIHITDISKTDWFFQVYSADTFFKLYVLNQQKGKIYVLPKVMAVYRLHKAGVWSMIDSKIRKAKMIDDFNILIRNFSYSANHKQELLKFYLLQYFLFDMRNFKIQRAFNTLFTLV
jgi:glycosyltransferase involved in cell wall biosynthesis